MEFTPHSAMQVEQGRICQFAVEVFEGDVPILQEAEAQQLGKLEVGTGADREDVGSRAAEYGATHVFRVAQQRQMVQSGGMMVGTGGPGFSTGVMIPQTHEETWTTYVLYRAAPDRIPPQLRCPPPSPH